MKFHICRTSACSNIESPCKEAVRNDKDKNWYIEISTLEELLALVDKCGETIILQASFEKTDEPYIPQLEIYDDYKE